MLTSAVTRTVDSKVGVSGGRENYLTWMSLKVGSWNFHESNLSELWYDIHTWNCVHQFITHNRSFHRFAKVFPSKVFRYTAFYWLALAFMHLASSLGYADS